MNHRAIDAAERAKRCARYPLGAALSPAELDADPYPHLARLQAQEPVSWIDRLGLWYVTRYDDVREILLDVRFGNESPHAPVRDTFGPQMLSVDGPLHDRWRAAAQPAFTPSAIRTRFEPAVRAAARGLVGGLAAQGETELREAFASRLPVLSMLFICGLDRDGEGLLRRCYDVFGEALANFSLEEGLRREARRALAELHGFLDGAIAAVGPGTPPSLLTDLLADRDGGPLDADEVRRNLSIVFFGGISTVEALILNTLWALATHPQSLARVRANPGLLPAALEESIRWRSPVQSATRHAVVDADFRGARIRAGEIVNCMLGAANRDPSVFEAPARFDIDRPNARRHLGFATGPHACLGFQIAKSEARIALEELFAGLPGLEVVVGRSAPPSGAEFHQPRRLTVVWRAP